MSKTPAAARKSEAADVKTLRAQLAEFEKIIGRAEIELNHARTARNTAQAEAAECRKKAEAAQAEARNYKISYFDMREELARARGYIAGIKGQPFEKKEQDAMGHCDNNATWHYENKTC